MGGSVHFVLAGRGNHTQEDIMQIWIRSCAAAAVAGIALLLLSGCGTGKSKVWGKVKLEGKTVVWGSVTLVDSTGMYHQGDIDLQGNYKIDKVPFGTLKIGVVSPRPDDPRRGGGAKGGEGGKISMGIEDPREKFLKSQG